MEPKVTCFENQIPDLVEHELDRLYGSIDSSLRQLRLRGEDQGASTWVLESLGRVTTILLYRVEGRAVRVLTCVLDLSAREANDFADFVFDRYPGVSKIVFPAVALDFHGVRKPRYARIFRSDVVIDPAPGLEAYQQSLSKQIRKTLNRKRNLLLRDHPDLEIRVHDESNFSEPEVRQILAFSRTRIEGKGETWGYSEEAANEMLALLRQGGIVCVCCIGGQVCGGSIGFRFGRSYSFKVYAFDERYAKYSLGFYMVYLANLEALRRNAIRIHMGFMIYDYKLWLGGVARRLDRVLLYRSHVSWMRDAPANLADYLACTQREVLTKARLASRREDLGGACLRKLRAGLRAVKVLPRLMRSMQASWRG